MIRTQYWISESAHRSGSYLRRCRIIVTTSLLVLPSSLAFGVFYAAIGVMIGLYINLFAILIILFNLFAMKKWGNANLCGSIFALTAFVFFVLFSLTVYGLEFSSTAWLLMVPIAGFLMVSPKAGLFWAGASILAVVVFIAMDVNGRLIHPEFDSEYIPLINFMTSGGLLLLVSAILYSNEKHKETIFQELEAKKSMVESQKDMLEEKNTRILDYNRKLEAEVLARTKGLQLSKEELDTFLYESSHALRRPVVRIIGLGNVIDLANSEKEAESYLQYIESSARKMDQMLHDLLMVSEVNHHRIASASIPLAAFVARLVDEFDAANPFQLRTEIQIPDSLELNTDTLLLRMLLEKLFLNASQFKKTDQEVGLLNISAEQLGDRLVLELKDRGTGIHPAALPDVFRMFSKGSLNSSGSGLGLYIARKAAQRLGAQLEAESKYESHSILRLSLPFNPVFE